MLAMKRVVPLFVFCCVLLLAGCGGGTGAPRFASSPTGSFSNANLAGTYAFSASGTNSFGFLTIAGSLQADGSGHITGGVEDVNSGNGVFTNLPITGTYTIGADGRGIASLTSSVTVITLDFVMISNRHGLVVRFDPNSSANGTIDLQNAAAFVPSALNGTFAFSVAGVDANGNNFQTAGKFTTDGIGAITSGTQDANDAGAVTLNQPLTGVYTVASNGRGIAALNTTSGTLTFAFYVVDSTHLKMIETDNTPALAGDAFRQQGTFSNATVSGSFAFTLAGSAPSPFAAGGIFSADGNGIVTSGVEDINNAGSVAQNLALTGSYTMAATGRGTLTLNSTAGAANFAIYPSTGGLQMLQIDSSTVSSGTAFPQQGSPFSTATVTGNYGFSLTGVSNSGEFDILAQFSATGSGSLTGAVDINNSGTLSQSFALTGTYSVNSNGRGTAAFKSSGGNQNLIFYVVGNSKVLVLETDSGLVAIGSFEH